MVVCEFVPTVCLTEAFEDHNRNEEREELLAELAKARDSGGSAAKNPEPRKTNWNWEQIAQINLVITGVLASVVIYSWMH